MKILMINCTKMVNDSGGVAKVCCAFANEMVARGHQVSIMHSDDESGNFFFPIDDKVTLYNVKRNADGSLIKYPSYLKVLRELYRIFNKRKALTFYRDVNEKYLSKNIEVCISKEKPDVIVSYQIEDSVCLLYNLQVNIPVISMSHIYQKDYYDIKEQFALEHSAIYQVLVHAFEGYINNILPKVNTITIGNAIQQYNFSADLDAEKKKYKIVFVGRLTKEHKRPQILIEAFSKIANKYPDWIVEIWGQTFRKSFYNELENMIKRKNLRSRIFLKGTSNNIPNVLENADIFAFPSKCEGFGMALAEGMSAGLPAIGFRTCVGVNELIVDGENGFLCDDGVEAFSEALERLMRDKALRVRMGKVAKESMKQFSPHNIWDKWENLLKSVV